MLKSVKKTYYSLLIGAVVCVCTGTRSWIGIAVGLGLLLLSAVVLNKYWRCPACGKQLGKMRIGIFNCPHCNEKIDT